MLPQSISKIFCILLFSIIIFTTNAQTSQYYELTQIFKIDLSAPATTRYTQVALAKKQYIIKFIDYLHTTLKYHIAFKIAQILTPILQYIVDKQFLDQCDSIAKAINRPLSQLIVYNFMYELGAYKDFCTSISIQNQDRFYLARNLDYGYQQYLLENSVILQFFKDEKLIIKSVGHAGLIGLHTGIRINSANKEQNYAVSLNQRTEGGLHKTLWHIFKMQGQTAPYLLMQALRKYQNVQQARKFLYSSSTYSAVYYILNSKNTNCLIQKSRKGSQAIFQTHDTNSYIVQTNTDLQLPDPDTRRDIATQKIQKIIKQNQICQQSLINILSQYPNKNQITLLTVFMDAQNEYIYVKAWQTQ